MAAAGKWHTAPVTRSLPLPQVTAAALPALQRRTSAVLVVSQILGGLGVAVGIALAPMLAAEVSGSEALSGLAPTASVIGTALLSLPLAALMTGRGRRANDLVLAYLIGALGGGLVVVATMLPSFPLLLLGMAAFGAGSLAGLQARFAAADLVGPERRGRAISTVVWATTIGSVLGPNISAPASFFRGTPIPEAAGPYLCSGAVFLVAALVVALALRPDPLLTARALAPEGPVEPPKRSLAAGIAAVRESPTARLALVTVAVSHTVMVSIMVMTPVDLGTAPVSS